MAKLKSHGQELLRISREREHNPTDHIILKDGTDIGEYGTTWEKTTKAYMADGKILQKHDVRFKPDSMDPKGRYYSYGWKLFGKMKPGHSIVDLVAKTRDLISNGKTSWKLDHDTTKPVVISQTRVLAACESGDSIGFCKACGAETDGVEPDARGYRCESCGQAEVYGAEEMLIAG